MKTTVARTRLFELYTKRKVFDGREFLFEYVRRPAGVRALIPDMPRQMLLLTREYREETDGWDYRLPGGKLFDTLNEEDDFISNGGDAVAAAAQQAAREVQQEAGLTVSNLKLFHTSVCGAAVEWTLYYFVAESIVERGDQALELGEQIEPVWVTFREAYELAMSGQMQEDRSVSVLLRWLHANAGGSQ